MAAGQWLTLFDNSGIYFARACRHDRRMNTETATLPHTQSTRRFSGPQVAAIVAGVILVTILATVWIVKTWFFPAAFKPVSLSQKEEQVLEQKIERLEGISRPAQADSASELDEQGVLKPEIYQEQASRREIRFSEKELNALLARNTNLASRLAIDLSDSLASAKLLIPLDPDFPIMGGKTIKVAAGAELAFDAGRPMVVLKGVSIMGVPVPNAWLGNLKNVDLVQQFGGDRGFWKAFSDGVEFIQVEDGELFIKLRE